MFDAGLPELLAIISEAPRAPTRGIFTASAKPAEAYPPTLIGSTNMPSLKRFMQADMFYGRRELRWIPFSRSSSDAIGYG